MNEDSPAPASGEKIFTPAERIAELNDIDKSVSSLLKSAGAAISILINEPASTSSTTTLASQKNAFTTHSNDYFANLSSIDVRLRRQVYALEEAGLIQPGDERRDAKRGAAFMSDETSRGGGNGPLDASWLNARTSDSVSKGMDREIWAQAKYFVERSEKKNSAEEDVQEPKAVEDSDMEVDAPRI